MTFCPKRPTVARILRLFVTFIIGWFAFVTIPAFIFTAIEGWAYTTSIYYTIVSLTTVGFGDVVAGNGYTSM